MAGKITPTPEWSEIDEIAETDVVKGGPGGKANSQAKALGNRTEFLQEHKADQSYVDSTFAGLSLANKTYATVAAANADIANIAVNQSVWVSSEAEGGLYEKKTADATSLTKSGYDPLTQAKADATTKANAAEANAKDYVDNNSSVKIVNPTLARINYDTVTRTLNFTSTIYVVKLKGRVVLKVPQTLTFATNGKYRLEFNPATLDLRAIADTQATADGWAIAAYIEVSDTGMFTPDFLYAVNGVPYVPPQMGKIVTQSLLTVNLNTVSSLLECKANGRVVADTVTVPTLAANIPLPTTNGLYKLVHNVHTASLAIVLTSVSPKMGDICLATLLVSNLKYTLYDVDDYYIDGVKAQNPSNSSSTPSGDGVLLTTDPANILVDFNKKLITISNQSVRYIANGKTSLLNGMTLDLSGDESRWHTLVITADKTLAKRSQLSNFVEGDVKVGMLKVDDQMILGIPYYKLTSRTVIPYTRMKLAQIAVPFIESKADYVQAELPSFTQMWSDNNGDYNKFYKLYDDLMALYPDYITKTTLGNDALGNPIHEYIFSTPQVPTVLSQSPNKPKVLIMSGIHGGEKTGMYCTFYALREITQNWRNNPHLKELHWSVEFSVLPVCNPTGYNANSRWNHNNVDLNRNFDSFWSASNANAGSGPASEPETVIIQNWMLKHKDAVLMSSHHNFGDNSSNFTWCSGGTVFSRDLAKKLIVDETIRAKERYTWMPQADNYYVGYSDLSSITGGEGSFAVEQCGINGTVLEICSNFPWESLVDKNTSAVATIGTEIYINWILLNLKYYPQLYNSRINI